MIRLDTYQRKLQAVLGGAVATTQPTSVVCYTDKENENQKKFFIEAVTTALNGTTAVDICPAPDKAMVREIDSIHINNKDTAAITLTVRINDNGTNYELVELTILSGETLVYTKSSGWKVITQYGNVSSIFNYIDFSAGTFPEAAQRVKWNDTDGTLDIGLKGGLVNLPVGLEEVMLVKESSNAGITKGKVYYFVGSDGANKTVAKAIASNASQTDTVLGVAAETTTGGNKAFLCTFGLVRNIDTDHLTEGAQVYLSAATAGELTATKPSLPNHVARIGYCIRKSATVGAIFVDIQEDHSEGQFLTLKVDGAVEIKDGMTAPTATAGYAKIYVDSADGDLKVIFADGTVKTIVTDT